MASIAQSKGEFEVVEFYCGECNKAYWEETADSWIICRQCFKKIPDNDKLKIKVIKNESF